MWWTQAVGLGRWGTPGVGLKEFEEVVCGKVKGSRARAVRLPGEQMAGTHVQPASGLLVDIKHTHYPIAG